jgi:hypothetical protein
VKFVQFDVRNHIVRRLPLLYVLRFLARRIPGWGRGLTANAVLERDYARFLYGDRCLYELPERPRLHILTTNVSNGGLSAFNRDGLFDLRMPLDHGMSAVIYWGEEKSHPGEAPWSIDLPRTPSAASPKPVRRMEASLEPSELRGGAGRSDTGSR